MWGGGGHHCFELFFDESMILQNSKKNVLILVEPCKRFVCPTSALLLSRHLLDEGNTAFNVKIIMSSHSHWSGIFWIQAGPQPSYIWGLAFKQLSDWFAGGTYLNSNLLYKEDIRTLSTELNSHCTWIVFVVFWQKKVCLKTEFVRLKAASNTHAVIFKEFLFL